MDPYQGFVPAKQEYVPSVGPLSSSFSIIPARIKNTSYLVDAIVSPEDYDMLTAISPEWSVSSNGYVVFSKRVNKTYVRKYMHVEIMGVPATHINGDRLDNRRQNLIPKTKTPSSKRPLEDLDLKSIIPVDADFQNIPENGNDVTIRYPNKIYSGEVHNHVPHGFGTLTEIQKTSLGWWLDGKFKNGLVIEHKPLPPRIVAQANEGSIPMGPVKRAFVWWNDQVVYSSEI